MVDGDVGDGPLTREAAEAATVLLVSGDPLARTTLARELLRAGFDVRAVTPAALAEATEARPRVIIVDMTDAGSDLLDRIEASIPRCRIVVRTNVMLDIPARRAERYEVIAREAPTRLLIAAVKRGLGRRGHR